MTDLRYVRTLYFYDGHQLIVASDPVDTKYVCLLVSEDGPSSTYFCFPVSPRRLRELQGGQIDLLSAIEGRETEEWLEATATSITESWLGAVEHRGAIPTTFLPDAGFHITEPRTADVLVSEANARHNLLVEVKLDPPEAVENRIAAQTLGAALTAFQSVVKNAYIESVRKIVPEARASAAKSDVHLLDVYAFAPGSFKVHLESRRGLGLFGDSELGPAMELLQSILDSAANPDMAMKTMAAHRGHFVSSFVRMLKVLDAQQSDLQFAWAIPRIEHPRISRIGLKDASTLLARLAENRELSAEIVTVVGRLTQADEKNLSWRIFDDQTKTETRGTAHVDAVSFAGLVIDARYRITCEERIVDDPITGREKRKLFATRFVHLK